MDDEGKIIETGVESEDLSVVVEELFLRGHSATTERLLHELFQFGVSKLRLLDLGFSKGVQRNRTRRTLRLLLSSEEFTGVLITICDSNVSAKNHNVVSYLEVKGEEGLSGAVFLQELAPLEELALGSTTVFLSRLTDHDSVVF